MCCLIGFYLWWLVCCPPPDVLLFGWRRTISFFSGKRWPVRGMLAFVRLCRWCHWVMGFDALWRVRERFSMLNSWDDVCWPWNHIIGLLLAVYEKRFVFWFVVGFRMFVSCIFPVIKDVAIHTREICARLECTRWSSISLSRVRMGCHYVKVQHSFGVAFIGVRFVKHAFALYPWSIWRTEYGIGCLVINCLRSCSLLELFMSSVYKIST